MTSTEIVAIVPPEKQKEMPKRKPRATAAEREERVNFVYGLIVNAYSRFEIIELCREKYGIGRSVVDDAIRDATKQLTEDWKPVRKAEAEKAVQRFQFAYKRGMELGQVSAAVAAQSMICKIMGVKEETVTASDKFADPITFTIEKPKPSVQVTQRTLINLEKGGEVEDNSDIVLEPIEL